MINHGRDKSGPYLSGIAWEGDRGPFMLTMLYHYDILLTISRFICKTA